MTYLALIFQFSAIMLQLLALRFTLCTLRSFVRRVNFFMEDTIIHISRPLALLTKGHAKKIDLTPALFLSEHLLKPSKSERKG